MSEEKKNEQQNEPEAARTDTNTLKNAIHLWPDEKALKASEKKAKKLKIALVTAIVVCLLFGWAGGSLLPFSFLDTFRSRLNAVRPVSSDDKITQVLKIMENDWYFASGIDNLDERLTDQALKGITDNSEDTHTEYMSKDEVSSFTTLLNRSYVGIGIAYEQSGGVNAVTNVFPDTPADKAGIKVGDIIHSVNDQVIDGMSSTDIKSLIQGDAGTKVTITFIRDGQYITKDIERADVSATVYAEKLSDGTLYLKIVQFGSETPDSIKKYLQEYVVGSTKLIIDLRNNGGGYLNSVTSIASLFLPEGTTVMTEQFASGPDQVYKTTGGQVDNIGPIAILVNENTASASEILTLALRQERNDATVIGTTTYGKGTVQVTRTFTDGSAIKYTNSKWVAPDGTWINGVGITPDQVVKLPDVMYEKFATMEDTDTYAYDSVADAVKDAQMCLDYLGYGPGRTDGYFSQETAAALTKFQQEHNLTADGVLNKAGFSALATAVVVAYNSSEKNDTQLQAALEAVNG